MELKRTLSNLSKDDSQSMKDYLRGIKQITDSLTSISSLVLDMDLIILTLNGIDEDWHILATTLSYGTSSHTFDDLRAQLIQYGQRLKFLKTKGNSSL